MTVQTGPLQIRRLTTAQLATVVPAIGEPVYNKTTSQFRLGDGVTVGGLLLGSPLTTYAATFLTSTDSATARTALVAAQRGSNSDITSLSGLTTALSVAQGGTGSTTAAGARTALSAAVSGANSDITSLTGLTTPLSLAQGGTGGATAVVARANLGLSVFTSTAQSYTNGGSYVVAHGLSTTPTDVSMYAICLTAEGGYSVGNTISLATSSYTIAFGPSNLLPKIATAGLTAINFSTGVSFTLTPANWQVVFKARL